MTSHYASDAEEATPVLEYQVLGPLSARSGTTRVELGGRRQRMVLAVLLSNVNRVIAQDALVDAVWNGEEPATGPRSLQTYISTLRKSLQGGIERDGTGYVLRAEPEQVDANRFETLVAEARARMHDDASGAATVLRQALGLWTGPAYGDLAYETALVGEATRLAAGRVAALELRFETELLLGRHEEIISEIEALLSEEPYREHVAGMLMVALYRSGRQAEALRVYDRVRRQLVDELGIEPGPDLQDLELQILQGDPRLQAPAVPEVEAGGVTGARGYEIHEPVGRAGFGDRYRGFHSTMAREVAVLVVDEGLANSSRFIRRFEAEMQAVSRFEHPHLAPVLDYWRDPSTAYVITPFYRGGTLEDAIADRPLTLAGAIRVVDQLSAAVGVLHRSGYAHGALSAASVLLDEGSNAYLADAGLDRAVAGESRDEADDVYQLGVLAFRVLTLEEPDPSAGVSTLRDDLPSEIDHAISRAMHPEPGLRYQRIEDFARALRQSAGLDTSAMSTETLAWVDRRNPYKGLRAFQEADASDFHGRDALVEEMVEALTATRLLVVVGPSGSGKSSAVRAGLVPRLRTGVIASSAQWLITDMFPGSHPFEALEAALLRVAVTRPPHLLENLTASAAGLSRAVEELVQTGGSEILVVIDQFEELFSMAVSTADRQRFLDMLVSATGDESRVRFVLTLRADFFDQPLKYPDFAEIFRTNVVAVGPPTRDGLARAISQPAVDSGVSLEPGLVTRIVDDVREQPGGLPLLQFALTELFAQRQGDVLTLASYEASGGVGGALALRAEETYSSLSAQGREAARQLFLRLVTVDELADDTRRRVRQSELMGLALDQALMSDTMQQFGALRFLSFDRDPASRAPTVELAHESLLTEWRRLRTWIDERREDLLIHRRIQLTVQDWRDSGDDPSYLLRGNRLEQAQAWMDRTDISISDEETRLIEASIETEKTEMAEREALEAKAVRRRKAIFGVLAGGLVVAGVLGAIAIERAGEARVAAAEAQSRELATSAIAVIPEDPELGVLLSLEAFAATDAVGVERVPEAASALRTTLGEMRVVSRIPAGHHAVAYNGDGTLLATDDPDSDSTLHLWETSTNRSVAQWVAPEQPGLPPASVVDMAFSPDDDRLAVVWGHEVPNDEEASIIALSIHDGETLDREQVLMGLQGSWWYPSFGAEGLVAASFDSEENTSGVYVWDSTGEVVETFEGAPPTYGRLIPGTQTLVLGEGATLDGSGEVVEPPKLSAIDLSTSEEVWEISLGVLPGFITLSPDGSKAAVSEGGNAAGKVEIWDLVTQTRLAHFNQPDAQALPWSKDGTRVALSGNNADITIIEEALGWAPSMILTGQRSSVWGTAFHPDGTLLAAASHDGETVIWDVTAEGAVGTDAVALGSPIGMFYLGPDDQLVAGTDAAGGMIVDLATGQTRATIPGVDPFSFPPNDRFTAATAMSRDVNDSQSGRLIDLRNGETIVDLGCRIPLATDSDARRVVLEPDRPCRGPSEVRDLETDEVILDLGSQGAGKAVFSPEAFDGPPYVAAFPDGLEIYSLDDRELVASYTTDDFGISAFLTMSVDPEGRYLGIGTNGPDSIVIDMEAVMAGTPKMEAVVFDMVGNKTNATQFRVTSDGIGASSSFDPIYRVWDITTDEFLFEINVDPLGDVGAVQFSHDGTQLAYEDAGGVIRFSPLDDEEVVARAEEVVTRGLSDDECRRYLHTDGCVAAS